MGFGEAIAACFANYAAFRGRASRSEFWYWQLFLALGSVVVIIVELVALGTEAVLGTQHSVLEMLFQIAVFLPTLAVIVRRLHDTDVNGWLVLILLVPIIGWIIALVMMCRRGDAGPNRFGPAPV